MKEHKRCLFRDCSDFTHKEDLARKTTAGLPRDRLCRSNGERLEPRAESNIAEWHRCVVATPLSFFYSTTPT